MRKFGFVLVVLLLFGFVLSGCDNGNKDENKDENKEEKIKGFTLTISDLPALEQGSGKGYGASLMASAESTEPLAVGIPNSGVFEFFHPGEGTIFPSEEPFITGGNYVLIIAVIDLVGILNNPDIEPEKIFMYTEEQEQLASVIQKKRLHLCGRTILHRFGDHLFLVPVAS